MEEGEPSRRAVEEEFPSSIPRGGPIFVPDHVSLPSRVPLFEARVFNELEHLKSELEDDLVDLEEDISVDELKLRTDEDLVTEAMEIIFEQGDQEVQASSGVTENPCTSSDANAQKTTDPPSKEKTTDPDTPVACESSSASSEASDANAKTRKTRVKKKPKSKKKTTDTDTLVSCQSSDSSEASDANVKKRKSRVKKKPKSKKKKTDSSTPVACESFSEASDGNVKKRKTRVKKKPKSKKKTTDPDTPVSCESSSASSEASDANVKKRKTRVKKKPKSKKRKTNTKISSTKVKKFDVSYLAKVEHLAKIRQKQEDDKLSVELHSFKLSKVKKDNAAVSSGKVETLKCVESATWPGKVKCSKTNRNIPIQYPEVVLCVEIYHHKQIWKKAQELLVLGRQTLTELRDKIRCLTDVVIQKASEEKDDNQPDIMYDTSGYFLIEDLFCNDMRDPNAIDYSEPIFDWLKNSEGEAQAKWDSIQSGVGKVGKKFMSEKSSSKLPTFRAVDMDKIRFCDLVFCLGAGYLYCHQGDCKHVIVIRDMRLIHPDDVQNRAAYPLLVHEAKSVLKKCYVCRIYKATKVTLDDKMAGENPCYFCETCYYLLHYSKDGNLLYSNFIVHDYLQDYC